MDWLRPGGGGLLDYVTLHPLFSLAPFAAVALVWIALRRRR